MRAGRYTVSMDEQTTQVPHNQKPGTSTDRSLAVDETSRLHIVGTLRELDMQRDDSFDDAPIGVFDSGFGGLTVVRSPMKAWSMSVTLHGVLTVRARWKRLTVLSSKLGAGSWEGM